MSKPVEITLPERTFICDEKSKATVSFTISNIIDKSIELAASIDIDEGGANTLDKKWLEIKVDPDWTLDSKATEELTVNVNIPEAQPLGDYKFKLTVYSKENPGDDFTTSEMICVKKQKIVVPDKKKKPFPWWIVVVILLLVTIAGAGWYFFTTVKLPDVTGQKVEAARENLENDGFQIDYDEIIYTTEKAKAENLVKDQVIGQSPDVDDASRVKKGIKVILKVVKIEDTQITVPDVRKKKLSFALQQLNKAGLEVNIAKIKRQYNKKLAEETVIKQSPAARSKVAKGTKINLTISTKTNKVFNSQMIISTPLIQKYQMMQYQNTGKKVPVK